MRVLETGKKIVRAVLGIPLSLIPGSRVGEVISIEQDTEEEGFYNVTVERRPTHNFLKWILPPVVEILLYEEELKAADLKIRQLAYWGILGSLKRIKRK